MHFRWLALAIVAAVTFSTLTISHAEIIFGGPNVGDGCTINHGDGSKTTGKKNKSGECCRTTCDANSCITECWSTARSASPF